MIRLRTLLALAAAARCSRAAPRRRWRPSRPPAAEVAPAAGPSIPACCPPPARSRSCSRARPCPRAARSSRAPSSPARAAGRCMGESEGGRLALRLLRCRPAARRRRAQHRMAIHPGGAEMGHPVQGGARCRRPTGRPHTLPDPARSPRSSRARWRPAGWRSMSIVTCRAGRRQHQRARGPSVSTARPP